jgi:hypothetical protein
MGEPLALVQELLETNLLDLMLAEQESKVPILKSATLPVTSRHVVALHGELRTRSISARAETSSPLCKRTARC